MSSVMPSSAAVGEEGYFVATTDETRVVFEEGASRFVARGLLFAELADEREGRKIVSHFCYVQG